MPEEKKQDDFIVLGSVAELQLDGDSLQLDLEDDAWSFGAPPQAGVYSFKWMISKDGIKQYKDKQNPKSFFIRIAIEGKLVDDKENEGYVATAYLDSRIFRGKQNSTMAGFVDKAGARKYLGDGNITVKKLATLAEAVLKKEPVVKAELDWRGAYSTGQKNKDGYDEWVTVAPTYDRFPEDKEHEGKRLHEFVFTDKKGEQHNIRAMVNVVRFLAKNETVAPKKTASVGAPVSAGEVDLVDDTPNVNVAQPSKGSKQTPTANKAEDDASLELMLQD